MTGVKPQKIAIIGTGAMGSIYAVMMAEAGHQVWAIDSWADHVEAINANGLRLEGVSGDRSVTSIQRLMEMNLRNKLMNMQRKITLKFY